jgi:xylan 1,4-beta-xylosidase
MNRRELLKTPALLGTAPAARQAARQPASLKLDFGRSLGPMYIERMAVGQGGLSANPMWEDRTAEIRALRPAVVRLFVQEYFDLLPERGRYHFDLLDRSIDLILSTGAVPMLSLCFKPGLLFPQVDQRIVEPADYRAWEDLIARLVNHYRRRNGGVWYWEVGNETDIGETGGCPYLFQPASYARYYRRTAGAILRADPGAKVGGPALASVKSPIFPALLDLCADGKVPLHFVSWHIYNSSPKAIRDSIVYAKSLLQKYPSLQPETVLNEWNMSLANPSLDPRFQPCFVAETIWQMKDAGLDWSCYYHIRDYHVDRERFAPFMSQQGAAFMARWWNRMPQFDGLFDYQNTPRPAYFAFKLLSRLSGDRRQADADEPVRAFLSWDETYELYNLLFWNFSAAPADVNIDWHRLPWAARVRRVLLDADTASNDENHRLRPLDRLPVAEGSGRHRAQLEPYGMQFWYFEKAAS